MKLKFLGQLKSITGSCHLVTAGPYKILLDCGMYQGSEAVEALNQQDFGFNPQELDYLLLSHAHIDHSGRIPLLIKRGFTGKIYCTQATAELSDIMLQDSGNIQERDAETKTRKALRAGRNQVEPLYTQEEAEVCRDSFEEVDYGKIVELNPNISVRFRDAGHILGSAIIELWVKEEGEVKKIVYSGDLGFRGKQMLNDPEIIEDADYLIMETTYGDRIHESMKESLESFIRIILETTRGGGNVIIPSFAVGRTQELIYELEIFYLEHPEYKEELDKIMVYIDSPLATRVTEVFRRSKKYFDVQSRELVAQGNGLLSFKNLRFIKTVDESKELNSDPSPKIIIASSGMCDFGRIKHHLKHNLWKPEASIVFVGYQAEGTLGREIVEGSDFVDIYGEMIAVKAQVHSLDGFSAHGDKNDLLEWLGGFKKAPRLLFLVHGETEAKEAFAIEVKKTYGYDAIIIEGVGEYELV